MHSFINFVLLFGFDVAPYGDLLGSTQSMVFAGVWLAFSALSLLDLKPQDSKTKSTLIVYSYCLIAAASAGLLAFSSFNTLSNPPMEKDLLFYGVAANRGFGILACCTGIFNALVLNSLNTASSKKSN